MTEDGRFEIPDASQTLNYRIVPFMNNIINSDQCNNTLNK